MIKGITITQPVAADELEHLAGLLQALGFEQDLAPRQHRGPSFLVPLAKLDLVPSEWSPGSNGNHAPAGLSGHLSFDVTSLGSIRSSAQAWLRATPRGGELSPITDADCDSRSFSVAPYQSLSITFRESNDPLRGQPVAVEGDLSAQGMRFAIVVARWNAVITDRLLQGALDALLRSGARRTDIEIVRVPGAWEIPSAARKLAEIGRVDAVIALGLLLRGETAHYEAIYNEVSRGIGQSQQETGVPHAFGVLTCETLEQALDRAGLKSGNKGFESAIAAIEMVSVHRKLTLTTSR